MDGVLVDSARLHARAWKDAFDQFLAQRGHHHQFKLPDDYRSYVDGRPRYEGVATFLESREIDIPAGDPSDPPGMETEAALGNLKNQILHRLLDTEPIRPLEGVEALLNELGAEGTPLAVVSSSRNTDRILPPEVVRRVDLVLGGKDLEDLGIPGKPHPDMFIRAARDLGFDPVEVAIVEDSPAGVIAGRRGGFSLVVGVKGSDAQSAVDRADVVVPGALELPPTVTSWSAMLEPPPPAQDHMSTIREWVGDDSAPLYVGNDETKLLSARMNDGIGVVVRAQPPRSTWADFWVRDEAVRSDLLSRLGR